MSYQNYLVAAYMVFAVVLLWDFVAPHLRLRQLLRIARQAPRHPPNRNQVLPPEDMQR